MSLRRRSALFLALAAPLAALLANAQRRPGPPPKGRPNLVDRLRAMPPAERRRFLDRLPPDRRKQAEDRMDQFDRLTPEEQQELARRYEFFQKLPPARQEEARRLYRDLNALPPERHAAVRRELDQLRAMSSAERATFFRGRAFKSAYNRKERSLLEDYVSLLEAPLR